MTTKGDRASINLLTHIFIHSVSEHRRRCLPVNRTAIILLATLTATTVALLVVVVIYVKKSNEREEMLKRHPLYEPAK